MVQLFNFKILRLYSLFSCTFASQTTRYIVGDLKTSPFSLQNMLSARHFTSEISENQLNFTVNYLINSCGLSPEGAIIASKRLELHSPERPDSVLALLRNHGFSQTQISKLVRSCSELLQADPEKTLLPKIKYFSSLGVSREDLAKTLAYNPKILTTSLEKRIVPTCDFLRSLLSENNVVSVFKRSWIFTEGHFKNVVPNIGILRELGMPESCISMLLAHHPVALSRKPEKFCEVVDEVKQMGFNLEKSTSIVAIRALCGNNSKAIWNRKLDVYKRWGWSEDDVLSAFRKNPVCMAVSEKKITKTMEFLVNKMGWPSGMIASTPVVMCYSLEKRIIPRCLVVKVLLLKGLINENFSLSSVMVTAEKNFLEKFVAKYIDGVPQLLSVYQGKIEFQDV